MKAVNVVTIAALALSMNVTSALAALEDYAGRWIMPKPGSRGRMVLNIDVSTDPPRVTAIAKCLPQDCPMGTVTAHPISSGGEVTRLLAEFDLKGTRHTMILRAGKTGLVADVMTTFDGKGGGYSTTEGFIRDSKSGLGDGTKPALGGSSSSPPVNRPRLLPDGRVERKNSDGSVTTYTPGGGWVTTFPDGRPPQRVVPLSLPAPIFPTLAQNNPSLAWLKNANDELLGIIGGLAAPEDFTEFKSHEQSLSDTEVLRGMQRRMAILSLMTRAQ